MHGPTVTRLRSAGTQTQHSVTQGRRKPRPLSHAVTFWVTSATTRFHTHPSATPWPSPMHVHTHTGTRDHLRAHNPPFAHRLPRAGTPLHTHKHTLIPVPQSGAQPVPTHPNPGTRTWSCTPSIPCLVLPSPFPSLPGLVPEWNKSPVSPPPLPLSSPVWRPVPLSSYS